jgi:hypothetical protein
LIVQRMTLAADDQVGRRRWIERVRHEWPDESYSGGLAIPLGQLLANPPYACGSRRGLPRQT